MAFSTTVVTEALLACGRCCCLCHKFRDSKIETHHIEHGGPDTFDNCIPLCFDCHTKVGHYNPKHPKGRKFRPTELKGHRDRWYERVRKGEIPDKSNRLPRIETYVQAIEVSEIRKLQAQMRRCHPKDAEGLLAKFDDYNWWCGDFTKVAILEALSPLARMTRHGLTSQSAEQISHIVINYGLPDRSIHIPLKRPLSKSDKSMYELGSEIGVSLAYDGALYLKNLFVVRSGANILWRTLRIGWLYRYEKLIKKSREYFDQAISGSERGNLPDAKRLLIAYRDQAMQSKIDDPIPKLDDDLEEFFFNAYKNRHA